MVDEIFMHMIPSDAICGRDNDKKCESSRSPAGYGAWVGVDSKFPDNGQCVDVWYAFGDMEGRLTNVFYDPFEKIWWSWTFKEEDQLKSVLPKPSGVTHWMPLPDAP